MSVLKTASENDQSVAVGSFRRATGVAADSKRGGSSPDRRSRFLVSRPEGYMVAAFPGTRRGCVRLSTSREPGRASLIGRGAFGANTPSTANKSLKYVPGLSALHRTRLRAPLS